MRLLLLSDIHANLAALEAVLADARRRGYDAAVCLGDVLGYGPQPREVLACLRGAEVESVLGNHDLWALQLARGHSDLRGDGLRRDGVVARALRYQLGRLSPDDLAWLSSWPECRERDLNGLPARFRHGSPTSLLTYVDSVASARAAFAAWDGTLCFVGHTHQPGVYATVRAPVGEWAKHQALSPEGRFALPPGARVLLNPGSVGQPRDGDARASYGLFDAQRRVFEVHRAPYDVAYTQAAIRAAGLPEALGARLAAGT